MNHNKDDRTFSTGNLLFGLMIVLAGIYFLLQSLGFIDVRINIFKYWPALIVIAGLSMLKGKSPLIVGIVIAVSLFVAALIGYDIYLTVKGFEQPKAFNSEFSIGLNKDADSARIKVEFPAGRIKIDGSTEELVYGSYTSDFVELEVEERTEAGVQKVNIYPEKRISDIFWGFSRVLENELVMSLNGETDIDLSIDTGASNLIADLSENRIRNFYLKAGASKIDVEFGEKSKILDAELDCGASTIHIRIPKDAGVNIKFDAGLSSKTLPESFEEIEEGVYQTEGYETSERKIDLEIKAGASKIEIEQY